MSLRFQNTYKGTGRTPNYYANNNLYPGAYQRTQYQTRVSRRMHEGLSIDRNYGLDTTSDDLNSSPYSSPYYINGRYNSSNLTTQTGNSASVQGTKLLMVVPGTETVVENNTPETYMELWQGKQVRFEVPYTGKVTGVTLNLRNTGGSTGILSIYLSAEEDGPTLAEVAVDLTEVSQDNFEYHKLYANTPVPAPANPRGILYARMEIWDEIACERSTNPFNTGKKIEVYASGEGYHGEYVYELGEKNVPVRESYEFIRQPNRPMLGLVYNNWESVPVNRIEGVDYGATVSQNGYLYHIFCIKNATEAQLVIYDPQTNTIVPNALKVDGRTTAVNLVQAADEVMYVDGYSPLQKFQIGTWQNIAITSANLPAIGASIITFHANRVWLAGFRDDSNLVQYSEITDKGPEYDNFLWKFYSPDRSPLATSDQPITAMVEYQPDRLMITTTGEQALYATSADPATELPTQVSIHSDGAGVASSGDITNFRGVIYSFDPDEGIRRFTGSMWNKIPAALDSHIERVDMTKPRKLWGYAYKLYFNYTDAIDGKDKCIIWDMAMNYQQYPWFQDVDLPFCDVRADNDFNLIGIHPNFPCIMRLYAYDTWRRLDSPIVFERHTKRLSMPGNASDMILKRVFMKVMANSPRWWWFALETDADSLYQTRGNSIWYRMPVWGTDVIEQPVESPFPYQDIYEQYATALVALPNLNIRAISVQVKAKCKTFRAQGNLISFLCEAQNRPYL